MAEQEKATDFVSICDRAIAARWSYKPSPVSEGEYHIIEASTGSYIFRVPTYKLAILVVANHNSFIAKVKGAKP